MNRKNKINNLFTLNYKNILYILSFFVTLKILYLVSVENYLLFHSLAEIFGIIVVCCIFTITWNLRNRISNNYILFLGYAFIFIALVQLLHTLAFKGMNIFTDYPGANLATQLWISARYIECLTLLIAPYFINRKITQGFVIIIYSLITILIIASIFIWKNFPVCYTEATGLTNFKIYSEYIISLIFLLSVLTLELKRKYFDKKVLNLILFAIILKIFSELSFTKYTSVYGTANFAGHLFAIISYYLFYNALISSALKNPFNLIFKDLNEQNTQCIQEIDFIRAVIDTADVLIIVLDNSGRIVLFNKTCQKITGYVLDEVKGSLFWDIFIKEDRLDAIKKIFNNIKNGNFPEQHENFWKMKDGSFRLISWSNSGLLNENGEVANIVSIGVDITEITNLQHENKNIVSMIAHDMKSPLLTIQLFSNRLIKKWNDLDDNKKHEYLNVINNEGEKLNSLIDEFLEFSLMQHGFILLNFQTINPCRILDYLYNIYSVKAKEHGIRMNLTCSYMGDITGDGLRLNRVITNLLDNAIKFSDKNCIIDIIAYQEENLIKIEIKDTGPGIPEDDLPNIFAPFNRGKMSANKKGYGVGLAYVKTVVEKHKGTINVRSKPGEGTVFTIALPLN
ncbi:MAG: MASE3 domain-containing protein [Spirochaetota bacterium]